MEDRLGLWDYTVTSLCVTWLISFSVRIKENLSLQAKLYRCK